MEFKDKVRMYRKHRGMSQRDLAKECGVTCRTVAGWEQHGTLPRTDERRRKLAAVLRISVCDLYYGVEQNNSDATRSTEDLLHELNECLARAQEISEELAARAD